jgi:Fur family ferric uptake transcriptional regulator/Fur family peroxide stress response transcriptional regulator
LLAQEGRIYKIEIPDGSDCFAHICENHYHMRFQKCGRIFDVALSHIIDLGNSLQEAHGFTFFGLDIMIRGLCT